MAAYHMTLEPGLLEQELKKLILQETEKTDVLPLAQFTDDEALFGMDSRIGLDSLDALQISVALQTHFAVRLQGSAAVRQHMMCVRDLAEFVRQSHAG